MRHTMGINGGCSGNDTFCRCLNLEVKPSLHASRNFRPIHDRHLPAAIGFPVLLQHRLPAQKIHFQCSVKLESMTCSTMWMRAWSCTNAFFTWRLPMWKPWHAWRPITFTRISRKSHYDSTGTTQRHELCMHLCMSALRKCSSWSHDGPISMNVTQLWQTQHLPLAGCAVKWSCVLIWDTERKSFTALATMTAGGC
jgi:hypothetical protein